MSICVNLYGPKMDIKTNFDDCFYKLSKIGFKAIEPVVLPTIDDNLYGNNKGIPLYIWKESELLNNIPSLKEKFGIDVLSCNIGFISTDSILTKIDTILDIASKTSIKTFTVSGSIEKDDMAIRHTKEFSEASDILASHDLVLQYHNNYREFTYSPSLGMTYMEYLIKNSSSNLKFQIDVGWVVVSGVLLMPFLNTYKERITSLHLKDISSNFNTTTKEKTVVATGSGVLPLKDLIEFAKSNSIEDDNIIIDQDDTKNEIYEDLEIGFNNINKYLKK